MGKINKTKQPLFENKENGTKYRVRDSHVSQEESSVAAKDDGVDKSADVVASTSTSSSIPKTNVTISNDDEINYEDTACTGFEKGNQEAAIEIGDNYLACRPIDNKWYAAEIMFRRKESGSKSEYEYFVHYKMFNRRLDEWIQRKRIMISVVEKKPEGAGGEHPKYATRHQKRKNESTTDKKAYTIKTDEDEFYLDEEEAILEREYRDFTKIKYTKKVQFGEYELNPWYYSPYPENFDKKPKLWICPYCLKYMDDEFLFHSHVDNCDYIRPPGKEIYRKDSLVFFEIIGIEHKLYCQNLCLMAKLFLDHKTLFFDMTPFNFYVLYKVGEDGRYNLIGYFSKEIDSFENNNVSCIMVLPPHQRCGYGNLLISFSYELSKIEGIIASPEKPLSDLGKLSYVSYWASVLLDVLKHWNGTITIQELSEMTSIEMYDIFETLIDMQFLYVRLSESQFKISITPEVVKKLESLSICKPLKQKLDLTCLKWTPPSPKPKTETEKQPKKRTWKLKKKQI